MALTGTVQKFEDLPATAATGSVYKITGSADAGFVSYYVLKAADGTWNETVAPDTNGYLDANTMPHALVRQADGTFLFAPFNWQPRRVGDEKSNPAPAFVGRPIRDVFFYANRLGFLADETVMFSAAGDYSDFWRRTVLDYIASDALAASAATTDVAVLDYAVPFNDGIMLFSAQRQFSLTNGENGLSADSVEIKPVTNYLMTRKVRPAPLGSQVYFASDGGGNVQIQEYTRLEGTDATDAAEVSAHVPGLIPTGVSKLIAAPDLNAVFAILRGSPDVYAYQFFWSGNDKVLSAWRHWDFGDASVISGVFYEGTLNLLLRRGSDYSLETLQLQPQAKTPNQKGLIHLDRQVSLGGVYNPATNRTSFTFPYAPNVSKLNIIRGLGSTYPESVILPNGFIWESPTVISVPGDESAAAVTAGETYPTRFQFSRQYPQDYQGRPLTTGRLQMTSFTVNYVDSGYFEAEVQPYGTDVVGIAPNVIPFTGRLLGSASYRLGEVNYRTGAFTFSVGADASLATITLTNASPYASTFVSAEWEGKYFSRAR